MELESSRESGGLRTKVDLSKAPSYGIFPGQIVALEGTNISGGQFTATKVIRGAPAPMQTSRSSDILDYNYDAAKMNGRPMTIVVASGPYTLSDNLNYQPFVDLMAKMEVEKPDALILTGPFIDANHEHIKTGSIDCSLTDLFKEKFSSRIQKLNEISGTQVILVPSLQDAHHPEFVFPQAAFEPRELGLPEVCCLSLSPCPYFPLSSNHLSCCVISSLAGRHLLPQSLHPLHQRGRHRHHLPGRGLPPVHRGDLQGAHR